MLQLGLQRITRLVPAAALPWRAVHVAGTNGKGSVCAYAAAMLRAAGLRVGRFTSPHFLDRWDSIAIDGEAIDEGRFRQIEGSVWQKDRQLGLEASEFERLTATAFTAFSSAKVDVGVVEVGLGGRLDATNILQHPLATVITSIGMDHESLLGDTIEKIAIEKAGIMKQDVPCFVDIVNQPVLGRTLADCAARVKAARLEFVDADSADAILEHALLRDSFAPHQRSSIALAYKAATSALAQLGVPYASENVLEAVSSTVWPGRLQRVNISPIAPRLAPVLVDGAHNPQAARALRQYVDQYLDRQHGSPVTWVVGMSEGKKITEIIGELIRPSDTVITTEFGPVDGMPWVQSLRASSLLQATQDVVSQRGMESVWAQSDPDLRSALRAASVASKDGIMVVAGSLYLAADVLRLLRKNTMP